MKQSATNITTRRAKVLDYFFAMRSKYNARDSKDSQYLWLRPKDIKAKLISQGNKIIYRTFLNDIEFYYTRYVIVNKDSMKLNDYKSLSEKERYAISYMLTIDKRVHFHIPADSGKRLSYAKAITALLIGTDDDIAGTIVLPIVNGNNYQDNTQVKQMITYLFSGIVRDTFLSVKIFDCFRYDRGSLLSILVELAEFNQHINIDIEINRSKISYKNVVLESISLNEDMSIGLNFTNSNILVESLENIKNISILTQHYPKSDTGKTTILRINKKQIKNEMQKHDNLNRLKEWFEVNAETMMLGKDLDECINDILKSKIEGKEFLSRAHLLPIE
jgi:hypothetical protein